MTKTQTTTDGGELAPDRDYELTDPWFPVIWAVDNSPKPM